MITIKTNAISSAINVPSNFLEWPRNSPQSEHMGLRYGIYLGQLKVKIGGQDGAELRSFIIYEYTG